MFKVILVGTDGSPRAGHAVKVAAGLAGPLGAELHIVRGYRPPSQTLGAGAVPEAVGNLMEVDDVVRQEVLDAMKDLAAEVAAKGATKVTWHVLPLGGVETLLRVAGEVDADLIVVGNKGMQGARRMLGSVPNTLTHKAPCSVLLVDTAGADS